MTLSQVTGVLEALSEPLDAVDLEATKDRFRREFATRTASQAALDNAFGCLEAASGSISRMLTRLVTVAGGGGDIDLVARIAAYREPLARAVEEEPGDAIRVLKAVAACCLMAAAIDRFGNDGDGIEYLHGMLPALVRLGRGTVGIGRAIPGEPELGDTRNAALRCVLDTAIVLVAGRRCGAARHQSSNGGGPLDDRLEPRPDHRPDPSTTRRSVLELLDVALPGDCFLRARVSLTSVAAGADAIDPRDAEFSLWMLLRGATPGLRVELSTICDALTLQLRGD